MPVIYKNGEIDSKFKYVTQVNGEGDLAIFSAMNSHEDKPIYLIQKRGGHYEIEYSLDPNTKPELIVAIGLNGVVYKPS